MIIICIYNLIGSLPLEKLLTLSKSELFSSVNWSNATNTDHHSLLCGSCEIGNMWRTHWSVWQVGCSAIIYWCYYCSITHSLLRSRKELFPHSCVCRPLLDMEEMWWKDSQILPSRRGDLVSESEHLLTQVRNYQGLLPGVTEEVGLGGCKRCRWAGGGTFHGR